MAFITEEKYNTLIEAKRENKYANHICGTACALGGTKQFKVKGTKLEIKLKCTQKGGMWSGLYCFVVC